MRMAISSRVADVEKLSTFIKHPFHYEPELLIHVATLMIIFINSNPIKNYTVPNGGSYKAL